MTRTITRRPLRTLLAGAVLAAAGTLAVAAPQANAATPLATALAEEGVLEGSARADSYGAAVGINQSTSSYEWCAAFISWVMQQSGGSAVRSASVGDWVYKARHNIDGLSVVSYPAPGDLIAFDWDGNGDYAWGSRHIGMINTVASATSFGTIEGNTSKPGGGSDGVWRKSRTGSSPNWVLFIRVANTGSSSTPVESRPDAPVGWYTQNLTGASLASGTGVASQETGSLDVFDVNPDGTVRQQYYRRSQNAWLAGANFGVPNAPVAGRPGAASWAPGRVDMFVRTTGNALAQRYLSNGVWSGAWSYPATGPLLTSPAVASWGPNRLDVFSVSSAGRLTQAYYDGISWKTFREVATPLPNGETIVGAPAAVSWDVNRIDIVVRGSSGRVYQTYWNGAWGPWRDLMATANTALRAASGDSVAISSWGPGRLDVFVKMTDGWTWHQWYDNNTWSGFQNLASTSPNGPAAVSWDLGRVDVFYRSTTNNLGHDWFER